MEKENKIIGREYKEKIEEQNSSIEKKINDARKEWSDRIQELIMMMREIKKIAEAQVLMLSYRHMMVDRIMDMKMVLYRVNVRYDTLYKELYSKYKYDTDVRMNGGESNNYTHSDLSPLKRQKDMLQALIDYYSGIIDTLDNLGFAIKRRLELATDFT